MKKLAIILVGEDGPSVLYVKRKLLKASGRGIEAELIKMGEDSSDLELISRIQALNEDKTVGGIMVQLPLPEALRRHSRIVLDRIDPLKDVDCLTSTNLRLLESGKPRFYPAAVKAIVTLLEEKMGMRDFAGKKAVVLGNSDLVGRPLSIVLRNFGAQVVTCDLDTGQEKMAAACLEADIIVSAVGKIKMVRAEMVKPGAVVIDVGINRDENGKLVGDVDFEEVVKVAAFVSPVPGGVGPRTVEALLDNFFSVNGRKS